MDDRERIERAIEVICAWIKHFDNRIGVAAGEAKIAITDGQRDHFHQEAFILRNIRDAYEASLKLLVE